MATMRAVDIRNGAGPASALFINDATPRPQAKPSECLVKVKTFGLNRADTLQREGRYPVPPGVTKTMGLEFAGTVEEVGGDSASGGQDDYRKGDEVFGLAYGGGYAEYIAVSKKMLLRKPAALSWEVCGGLCEVWFTALQALHLVGEYSPDRVKSILWHAGASAVSIAGIQLSRDLASPPPKVFATTRRDEKCAFCVDDLGADAAFNTTKSYPKFSGASGTSGDDHEGGTWADEVLRATDGAGVDLIIDYVGAPYFAPNLAALARDGRCVMLGAMGGTQLEQGTDIGALLRKRASFVGSTLRSRDADYQGRLRDLFAAEVLPKLVEGKFRNVVDKSLSWNKIEEAHLLLEENKTMGKVVCYVD